MSNTELYKNAFKTTFSVEEEKLDETFCKDRVDNWDSLRQVCLVSTLEDAFDIMLDPEDIIAFNSYGKGVDILRKYNIEL